jgi:hypothetical protein
MSQIIDLIILTVNKTALGLWEAKKQIASKFKIIRKEIRDGLLTKITYIRLNVELKFGYTFVPDFHKSGFWHEFQC